jgi:hypothetical protein
LAGKEEEERVTKSAQEMGPNCNPFIILSLVLNIIIIVVVVFGVSVCEPGASSALVCTLTLLMSSTIKHRRVDRWGEGPEW